MSSDEDFEENVPIRDSDESEHNRKENKYQNDNNQKWNMFMGLMQGDVSEDADAFDMDSNPSPPLDLLFPDDLQKMRNELRILKNEKVSLTKKLEESAKKCELLKIEVDTNSTFRNPVTGAQLATSKIVELSKKVREMNAELSASKLQCNQLKKMIKKFSEIHEDKSNGYTESTVVDGSCGDSPATFDEQKKLKKKIETLQLQIFKTRSDGERLKNQLDLAYKVIEKEVGKDAESVIKELKDDSQNWRGRSEQIATLTLKLNELNGKLDTRKSSFMMNRKQVDALKSKEKEMKTEHQKEVQELKNQIEESRKNNVGTKARCHVLECELKEERNKIKILTEKSKTDDQMIDILKAKIKTNSMEKVKDKDLIKTLQNQLNTLQEELDKTKTKCDQLVQSIDEREGKIKELEEEKLRTIIPSADSKAHTSSIHLDRNTEVKYDETLSCGES